MTDGKLVVSEMISTLMACDPPMMDQEACLSTFLSSSPSVSIDGDELELKTDDASITAEAG